MEELEKKKYWIWLSLIKDLGNKRGMKLLEKYKTPEEIYKLDKEKLIKTEKIGEETANKILDIETRKEINKHIKFMKENQIDIITIQDKEYPNILKEIYDPPMSIYIKGNKEILNNTNIGIIGCRECTEYGKKAAIYFAKELAKQQNTNIVSGLAKGIDTYSHIGALEVKGKTIAILGNGLDTIYPKENQKLARKILENEGAIISEYPIGTKPEKMNFPARNRIISGISKSIIVIEAKAKSGTLITVDFALEQGRDVFCVPGNINSQNSIGTNELIKQGAMIATNAKDIVGDRTHWT